jgi:hypothetical protein
MCRPPADRRGLRFRRPIPNKSGQACDVRISSLRTWGALGCSRSCQPSAGLVRSADTRASDHLQITVISQRRGAQMGTHRRREWACANAARSVAATKLRILFASRAVRWLRRLLAHVTAIAHAKPTTEHAIITYADARVIRRTVLARLTTFERALLWRWCIGVAAVCVGLFIALLAILILATHAPL